ncbi:MAG: hypothetical protein IPP60_16610 [Sphingobacteriales bacterium]|nr:hypothetical protein [Sphingobacteriales bacterium]
MDDIFKQAYTIFSELIGNGMCILPPDKDFLFYEEYDFSYIDRVHRDEDTKLVGKREKGATKENPTHFGYPCADGQTHYIDFGDSANKTGHLAFCNSLLDQNNLHLYENGDGVMVRHPTQIPWNNPNNSTRDQLIAYAAGCWRAGKNEIVQRLLREHQKRTNALGLPLCQNTDDNCPNTPKIVTFGGLELFVETDVLAPHHIMFLKICAGDKDAYKDPIGQLFLQLDIEATTKDVSHEKNQLIVMAIVCGRLDLYVEVHDNYKENILFYWDNHIDGSDQKDQRQIGEAYIKVIEQELKRYSGQMPPLITGIPYNTIIALIRNFEYMGKIFKGDINAIVEYIDLFANALKTDIQKIAKEIEKYITNALKNPLNILNIPFMPFNPVAKLLNNLFNGTDLSEVYARLNEIQKGIINLTNLVKEIKDDVKAIPEKVAAYNASLELENVIQKFEINSQSYSEELNSNNQGNLDKLKVEFKNLADEMLDKIINYSSLNKSYPHVPFVLACMDIHLSSLAIAGEIPSRIKAILEKNTDHGFKILIMM